MQNEYRYKYQKKLRCGYTTGACAMAASMAGCRMLFLQEEMHSVTISLPQERKMTLQIEEICINKESVKCAVRKDAGDDKDVTNGILVYASVCMQEKKEITIRGGQGIGRVTKPGLDQPVGEAAINSGPRAMIIAAVQQVCDEEGYEGGIVVTISVTNGEEIAKKTFNPRLGIEGGISILGTTGIVEPMSEQALVDTIQTEIRMRRAQGEDKLLVISGNYGLDFVKKEGIASYEKAVICSNFIGETIDYAVSEGFTKLLLIGHIGKLVKLGSGIMNTHSHIADARLETLAICGLEAGVDRCVLLEILQANTTEEAIEIMKKQGCDQLVFQKLSQRIQHQLSLRAGEEMEIGAIYFSSKEGLLGVTEGARKLLNDAW